MAEKIVSWIMNDSDEAARSNQGEVNVKGNFLKITSKSHFSQGAQYNLVDAAIGDGALRLANDETQGEYLSPVYTVSDYNDLILSWNADTPPGSYVEIFARAYLPEYDGWQDSKGQVLDGWSDWITWGTWSPYVRRECPVCEDSHERKDDTAQDGWVFANAYGCGGDSSLIVRGSMTASKIQLMAKLYATHDAPEQPVLRLLAATWKNTNDPAWQDKCVYPEQMTEAKRHVLLDTPAISQMMRDPEYGNVICSATCITMQLNGLGTEVLPEDVSLLNYDYGFGGNGNWSFSAAAAGTYGHESYVHYASFEGLRQELSKGYAVALSVKYSNNPEGKHPYLENSPTSTGGHLITLVGYTYSDELGEYVYYSNDPAAKPDESVAHREYRESQLSAAWYRRATYFVHGKEAGAGKWDRIRADGRLLPVKDQPGTYALVTDDGELVKLPEAFLRGKRKTFNFRGSLCLTIEGEQRNLPNGVRRVFSNNVYTYDQVTPTRDGFVTFAEGVLETAFNQGKTATLYVVSNDGYQYTMTAAKENPVYDSVMGRVVSDDRAASATQAPQIAQAVPQTKKKLMELLIPALVGAGTALATVGVVALLRGKKRD